MSAIISVDGLFLFFLLIIFVMDIIGFKIPLVGVLGLGVAMLCILPQTPTEYASNAMIGGLGVLMILFTMGTTIINVLDIFKEKE